MHCADCNSFKYVFRFICLCATIIMICFWFYKFIQDDDLCIVDYKEYLETEDDVFPVMSLCFPPSFYEDKLAKYGVNSTIYHKYLSGERLDASMSHIDYHNVTTGKDTLYPS